MIKKISDQTAQDLLNDYVKYKLFVCESILEKVRTDFPSRSNYDTLLLETHLETLLFFMVSIQDGMANKIYRKLELSFTEDVNPYSIKKNLNTNDGLQNNVRDILDKYLGYPCLRKKNINKITHDQIQLHGHISEKVHLSQINGQYIQKYWFRDNSRLWELRTLRNQVSHSNIITTNTYIGGSQEKVTMIIKMTDKFEVDPHEFVEEQNLLAYFSKSLDMTKQFVSDIEQILQ